MFTNAEMIVGLWFIPVLICIVTPLTMFAVWSVNQAIKKFAQCILEKENVAGVGLQAHSA